MRKRPRREALRWWQQARQDFQDAGLLCEARRFHLTCFLSQQAAEKALRSYLLSQGAEEVWGHSVSELSDDALQFDESFRDFRTHVIALDQYYLPTRYPDALPGGIPAETFTSEDATRAKNLARKVLDFVADRVDEFQV